jgi:hypothetical protein
MPFDACKKPPISNRKRLVARRGRLWEISTCCSKRRGRKIEVECKTIAEDTGLQIKFELNVALTEAFRKAIQKQRPVDESGLFTMQLKRPSTVCRSRRRLLRS